ncbi:hypothetical protein PIB30_006280 [Stylosanthes scabra]|uniref:Uncharacterized protein n=1 Tax=Stylosanthes scabra TaxID=79078 RepID=A0ABU6Q559_9FABA|nr:hypothetical protein [Stylosanthes scabra]
MKSANTKTLIQKLGWKAANSAPIVEFSEPPRSKPQPPSVLLQQRRLSSTAGSRKWGDERRRFSMTASSHPTLEIYFGVVDGAATTATRWEVALRRVSVGSSLTPTMVVVGVRVRVRVRETERWWWRLVWIC